jgi:hypothetical protein
VNSAGQDLKEGNALGPTATVPAVLSAARWAKATSPDLFARVNADPLPSKRIEDRLFYDPMTKVLGALKAHDIDVERLARHTQHHVGDPARSTRHRGPGPPGRSRDGRSRTRPTARGPPPGGPHARSRALQATFAAAIISHALHSSIVPGSLAGLEVWPDCTD